MAEVDQVRDRESAPFDVVDGHGAVVGLVVRPVDDDDRDAVAPQPSDPVADLPDRHEQDAANPVLLEEREVRRFTIDLLGAVAELNGVPEVLDVVLNPRDDVGEERVGDLHHHHADRPTPAGPQLARRLVADPAEFGDRVLDPLPGRRGDDGRGVDHVRYRADGDTGEGGHVLDADRRLRQRHESHSLSSDRLDSPGWHQADAGGPRRLIRFKVPPQPPSSSRTSVRRTDATDLERCSPPAD